MSNLHCAVPLATTTPGEARAALRQDALDDWPIECDILLGDTVHGSLVTTCSGWTWHVEVRIHLGTHSKYNVILDHLSRLLVSGR